MNCQSSCKSATFLKKISIAAKAVKELNYHVKPMKRGQFQFNYIQGFY